MTARKIAIFHDHLSFIGGGERVVLTLASALDADLYVTDFNQHLPGQMGYDGLSIKEIAKVPETPLIRQTRQAKAFRNLILPDYDLYIFSGNWAVFASPRHKPNIWYCHTPVRVFYDLKQEFLESLSYPKRVVAKRWMRQALPHYESAVTHVQSIVANSNNVANRIQRYLNRISTRIYPPVKTSRFRFKNFGEFWLSVNRLSHEKRIKLQVEIFSELPDQRLVVVGGPQTGVDMDRFVRSLRPTPNVEFLGEVGEGELAELYATCRGLIATSMDEDFGITPVEAMASGKPVLAVDEGGYRETVVEGVTGFLLPGDPSAFVSKIESMRLEELTSMKEGCIARAREFDESEFIERMRAHIDHALERTRSR